MRTHAIHPMQWAHDFRNHVIHSERFWPVVALVALLLLLVLLAIWGATNQPQNIDFSPIKPFPYNF
jgi:hypothetical protein